jgi:hypothetical protein
MSVNHTKSSFLLDLEAEVQRQANNMPIEMVLLLLDRLDHKMDLELAREDSDLKSLLETYIRMKVTFHHINKQWDRGWSSLNENEFTAKRIYWSKKIKEARKNYYVTKQRAEKHASDCPCRGCKCIAEFHG